MLRLSPKSAGFQEVDFGCLQGSKLTREVLGEKAFKLLQLREEIQKAGETGFSIPEFEVIKKISSLSDFESLKEHCAYLANSQGKVIVRSSHPSEGNGSSFSGKFRSFKNVSVVDDSPDYDDMQPQSLEQAFEAMVTAAGLPYLREYCENIGIPYVDPYEMNAIIMRQLEGQIVFGMFVTSDHPYNPNLIRGQLAEIDSGSDPGSFVGKLRRKESYFVWDKSKQSFQVKPPANLRKIARSFVEAAAFVESVFGQQQVELAYSEDRTWILQARDFKRVSMFGDPKEVSKLLHETGPQSSMLENAMSLDMGYARLPVIVLEEPGKTSFGEKGVLEYKEYILSLARQMPEFCLILKSTDIFSTNAVLSNEQLAELSELTSKAKVLIEINSVCGLQHDEWDRIERGGISIGWTTRFPGSTNRFCWQGQEDMPQHYIYTGCTAEILANNTGVYIWRV